MSTSFSLNSEDIQGSAAFALISDHAHPPLESTREINILPTSIYASFLSKVAKSRKLSPVRELFPLEQTPGVISLLAGKPNDAMFPFTSVQFTVSRPDNSEQMLLKVDDDLLSMGLQYAPTSGIPPMIEWLTEFQAQEHGRRRQEGWRISVTAGSQDAIYKAIQALVDPGDPIFIEKPVYAGVIPIFETLFCEMIEIETDAEGLSSLSLHEILESWPSSKPKPKVLYTIPYGCNPTGATTSLTRRKEVLDLARKHNFMILEGSGSCLVRTATLRLSSGPGPSRVASLRFQELCFFQTVRVAPTFARLSVCWKKSKSMRRCVDCGWSS